jgi:hypothetical protein
VGTIAGLPETHKSWLAQATAVKVAACKGSILGCDVTHGGRVGYFWQDDSTREEVERVKTYERIHASGPDLPLVWYLNPGLQLPDDVARLRATVEREQLVLVVLDSFYNVLVGVALKDDQAEQIVPLLKREIADPTGCTVLIVDHMPWATDTNRQRLRAYGGVFKNAATRFGVYIDAQGTKLWIEARGNNIRGFKRTPTYWDDEQLELLLVDAKTDHSEEELGALDWIVAYVTEQHANTSAGVPRGKVETAYHEAHGNHGRNLARRVIDRELQAAESTRQEDRRIGLNGDGPGEYSAALATGPGESPRGIYLYPASHAPSPLAAPPTGDTGESLADLPPRDPIRQFASPYKKGGERRIGGDGAHLDVDADEVERLAALARELEGDAA